MIDAADENAFSFIQQIEAIKVGDVSPERLKTFTSEEDFNGLTVELLIEIGCYICVAGNLLPAPTRDICGIVEANAHAMLAYRSAGTLPPFNGRYEPNG